MRRSPETSIKAWFGDIAAAALFVCALSLSGTAFAGVTSLCDTRSDNELGLDVSASDLKIDLVDLGDPNALDLDITIEVDSTQYPPPPDVDEMLRQMFDQAHAWDDDAISVRSPAVNPPLAELATPAIRTESSELSSDTDAQDLPNADDTSPAVTTQVPGVSEDDLRRYRRKMYRTDI